MSLGHTVEVGQDQADAVEAARAGGSPAPIEWERALPTDPDVGALQRRLLRSISTRIQHRAAITAARERPADRPDDVSATLSYEATGEAQRGAA